MEYFVKSGNPEKQRVGCVIVGVFDRRKLDASGESLDAASGGVLSSTLRRGDMDGKAGTTLVLHHVPEVFCDRILLVGLGRERDFDDTAFRKACAVAARALRNTGAVDAVSYLTRLPVRGRDIHWNALHAALTTQNEYYRFDDCRGEAARKDLPQHKIERLTLDVPRRSDLPAAEKALGEAAALGAGMKLARDLGNLPGNICTPTYLAEQAVALAKRNAAIKAKVLEQADLDKLGMGAFTAVARGSRQPPKLVVLEYLQGAKGEKPVALVGKGLTFDSGGISIKPSDRMDEMKFDMCGAAAVLGIFNAVAQLRLPVNLVGVIPTTENMPGGHAIKPGDIVTSMAGITVEILNTDAEGRLVLCDALTYAEKTYDPAVCIDMATLTGAIVVALGGYATGLFSNTAGLARSLFSAGEYMGDRCWELPLWPEYEPQIRSDAADIANIATTGGREAGAIIGATFLHKFTRKMKWAHLDIAGTAWKGKHSTGRPIPLMVRFLIDRVEKQEAA